MNIRLSSCAILIASLFCLNTARSETIGGDRLIVIDGDTVALPCTTGNKKRGCAEKIRLKAIDAPEITHPHCERELIKGLAAKARLREILHHNTITVVRSGERDRYGRTLGWLKFPDGSDVGEMLMQEVLALHWEKGPKAKAKRIRFWCMEL